MPKTINTHSLLSILKERFDSHSHRHPHIKWDEIEQKLSAHANLLKTIDAMEQTGGEPDVVVFDTGRVAYCDCATESPVGRRSLCYDPKSLAERKANKPKDSAVRLAEQMGATLLTEAEYIHLQSLEDIDTKTSSWILTPQPVRTRGGALFGDKRYGRTFIFHNGADSYYSSRGFRAVVYL